MVINTFFRNPPLEAEKTEKESDHDAVGTPLTNGFRRAEGKGSNPQRLAPHLISSQAANHSRTLRKRLRNTILRHLLLAVKGLFALCASRRKDGCSRISRSLDQPQPIAFQSPAWRRSFGPSVVMLSDYFRGGPDQ